MKQVGNHVGERTPKVGVIVVTHNSEKFIAKNMEHLARQSHPPHAIVIVDSGSTDPEYLTPFQQRPNVRLICKAEDVGFARGNNLGAFEMLSDFDYILFLNPDAFLGENFLEAALEFMGDESNTRVAAMTPTLLGYDIARDEPTGRIDSTGIFRTWYGRWYDRNQGASVDGLSFSHQSENVPAVCGALIFARTRALREVLLRGREVFDETFFMWKEDIDLSLRLRRAGWELMYVPLLVAHHCRGWDTNRLKMSRNDRLLSARNDIRICWGMRSPYLLYALLKYTYVWSIERKQGHC